MLPHATFARNPFPGNVSRMLDELGQRLKSLRLGSGRTQAELAAACGVVTSTITHIELGNRQPSLDVLRSWLTACGATVAIASASEMDAAARMVAALSSLPAERMLLVHRAAMALATLPDGELEQEARIMELRAARHAGGKSEHPPSRAALKSG